MVNIEITNLLMALLNFSFTIRIANICYEYLTRAKAMCFERARISLLKYMHFYIHYAHTLSNMLSTFMIYYIHNLLIKIYGNIFFSSKKKNDRSLTKDRNNKL